MNQPEFGFLTNRSAPAPEGPSKKSLLDQIETLQDGIPVLRDIAVPGDASAAATPAPATGEPIAKGAPVTIDEAPSVSTPQTIPLEDNRLATEAEMMPTFFVAPRAPTPPTDFFAALVQDNLKSAQAAPKAPAAPPPEPEVLFEPDLHVEPLAFDVMPFAERPASIAPPSSPTPRIPDHLADELTERLTEVVRSTLAQILPDVMEQAAREVKESVQAHVALVLPEIIQDLLESDAAARQRQV